MADHLLEPNQKASEVEQIVGEALQADLQDPDYDGGGQEGNQGGEVVVAEEQHQQATEQRADECDDDYGVSKELNGEICSGEELSDEEGEREDEEGEMERKVADDQAQTNLNLTKHPPGVRVHAKAETPTNDTEVEVPPVSKPDHPVSETQPDRDQDRGRSEEQAQPSKEKELGGERNKEEPSVFRPGLLLCCLSGNEQELALAADFCKKLAPEDLPYVSLCEHVQRLESYGETLTDAEVLKMVKAHFLSIHAALNVRGMTCRDLLSALGPCDWHLLWALADAALNCVSERHFKGFRESKEYRRLVLSRAMNRNIAGAVMQAENIAMIGLTEATMCADTLADIASWGVPSYKALRGYLTFGNRGNNEISRTREELELDVGLFDFYVAVRGMRCSRTDVAASRSARRMVERHLMKTGTCVGGWGVGGVPLRELLRGRVSDMPLLRCARRTMALACDRRSKELFETSLWGMVAASKSSFCPFVSVLLRLRPLKVLLDDRHAIKPQPVTQEEVDAAGACFPLGVPIPLGEALKMSWKTHCWRQTSFWIAGGWLAWSPDGFDFAPRGSILLQDAAILKLGAAKVPLPKMPSLPAKIDSMRFGDVGAGEQGEDHEVDGENGDQEDEYETRMLLAVRSKGGGCLVFAVAEQDWGRWVTLLRWAVNRAEPGGEGQSWWGKPGRCCDKGGGFRECRGGEEPPGAGPWQGGAWMVVDGVLVSRGKEGNIAVDGSGEAGDVQIKKHTPVAKDLPFTLELVVSKQRSLYYMFQTPWALDSFRLGVAGRRPSPACVKILLPMVVDALESGAVHFDADGEIKHEEEVSKKVLSLLGKKTSLFKGGLLSRSRRNSAVGEKPTWPVDLKLTGIKDIREDCVVYRARKEAWTGACCVVAWRVGWKGMSPRRAAEIFAQRIILGLVKHPFVMRVYQSWQSEEIGGGTAYMAVSDYAMTLGERLEKAGGVVSEMAVRVIAAELILAIEAVHLLGIVHRDINPETILIDGDGHVLLAGWGLSCPDVSAQRLVCDLVGTPDYQAPEVIAGLGWYGKEVDWWSLGIIIYEMLHGEGPFQGGTADEVYRKVRTEAPFYGVELSEDCIKLLTGLLQREPVDRLGADKLGGAATVKAQEFFANHGVKWDTILRRRALSALSLNRDYIAPPAANAIHRAMSKISLLSPVKPPEHDRTSPGKSPGGGGTKTLHSPLLMHGHSARPPSPPPPERPIGDPISSEEWMRLERAWDLATSSGGGKGQGEEKERLFAQWVTLGAKQKLHKPEEGGSLWAKLRSR